MPMGRSREILRNDLCIIHSALGEVLSCTRPQVPSWRFPEKLSASVTLDDVLTGRESEANSEREVFLEGIVDRLLLLLQSSLKLWNEETEGHHSHPLPLSLPSTVKKYCRKLLHRTKHTQDLQQQLTAKDVLISSLKSSLSKVQEECQLLQQALQDATSESRPSPVLPRCIPYEARNSLKTNCLQFSQSHQQPSGSGSPDQNHSLLSSKSSSHILHYNDHTSSNLSLATHSLSTVTTSNKSQSTVATQTAETTFALCVRCLSSQTVLASAAGTLEDLCCSLQLSSLMAETDWKREAETGILEPKKWGTSMAADLTRIKSYLLAQQRELESCKDEVAQQKSLYEHLQSKTTQLSLQCELLEGTVTECKKDHERELVLFKESAAARRSEMKAAQEMIQERSNRLEEELSSVQQEKAELRASLAGIERKRCGLQIDLSEVKDREIALSRSQAALQGQLHQLQAELSQCREELEANRLQLSKTSVLNHTLERKNKVILDRQNDVLQRLEELDTEAEDLRRELAENTITRNQLAGRVEELQAECSSLHDQLADYKSISAASAREQQCLHEELVKLQLQLASLSSELDAEKHKCRLLIDYPDQCSGGPKRPLSGRESQQQISANTIRILLLEEQNSELRETVSQHARQTHCKRKPKPTQPIPLWQSAVVTQAQSAIVDRDKAVPTTVGSGPNTPLASRECHRHQLSHQAPVNTNNTPGDSGRAPLPDSPPSRAISASNSQDGGSCSSLCDHMYTCADCDRMFPDRSILHTHRVTTHLIGHS